MDIFPVKCSCCKHIPCSVRMILGTSEILMLCTTVYSWWILLIKPYSWVESKFVSQIIRIELQLNRDTWAHEAVKDTVGTSFIFWQVSFRFYSLSLSITSSGFIWCLSILSSNISTFVQCAIFSLTYLNASLVLIILLMTTCSSIFTSSNKSLVITIICPTGIWWYRGRQKSMHLL